MEENHSRVWPSNHTANSNVSVVCVKGFAFNPTKWETHALQSVV